MEIDLAGVSVLIGIPCYGHIPALTTLSLALTAQACGAGDIDLGICIEQRGIVTVARDQVLDSFLRSGRQKLFWIDSDIVWEPDAFMRLLALSTMHDVVCAAYPAKTEGPVEFQVSGTGKPEQPTQHGLFPIHGVGLGFTIMDRAVCEAVARTKPIVRDQITGRDMAEVFRVDSVNGVRRGEDIAFFSDIRDVGFTVWLDPTISLGHIGEKGWRGALIDHHKETEHG